MSQSGQVILKIEGMSCNGCRGKVQRALQEIPGVASVDVDLAKKEAVIVGSANPADFVKTVEELGFTIVN